MRGKAFLRRRTIFVAVSVAIGTLAPASALFHHSRAQSAELTLISQETSTRAIALDSVTQKHEPFKSTSEVTWGNDNRARVMLFAMGLDRNTPPSDISASAEALFVHPNTLRQRLRRIMEISELDLRRDDWLMVEIAVKLVKLQEALGTAPLDISGPVRL